MKIKNKIKAVEVENILQKARENRIIDGELIPYTKGYEKQSIKEIVENAKEIHDKKEMIINPMYIHIPEWQREVRIDKAMEIGKNYDSSKWDVPKVIMKNGKLYCVDGMHRIYGAFLAEIESVVVEFLNITEMEAIDLFLNQSKDRTTMSQADYLKAAIAGKKSEYLLFREICKKHKVLIKGDDENYVNNPVGIFTSLSDGVKLAKRNPQLLDKILKLLGKLQWNGADYNEGKAYGAKVIRVLVKMYAYCEGKESDMEKCLLENCKGSKYFNDNLHELWQDSFFDFLSNVLEENMKGFVEIITNAEFKRRNQVKNII